MDSSLTKGYCLVVGTDQGINARARAHPDKVIIRSTLPDGKIVGPYEIELKMDALLRVAAKEDFSAIRQELPPTWSTTITLAAWRSTTIG
jgi:hypothetical protein